MRAILFTVALLALALPANADHCVTWTTHAAEYDTKLVSDATGTSRYYGADDCFAIFLCQVEIIFSFWVYEESNGIDGLQRDDEVVDDTCHDMIRGDTIIL